MKFLRKDRFNLFNHPFAIASAKTDAALRAGLLRDDFTRAAKAHPSYCVLFWCITLNCSIHTIVSRWHDLTSVKLTLDHHFKESWKPGLSEKPLST